MTADPGPPRAEAEARDREAPLAGFRARFAGLDDRPYLMGNSLGPLPRATEARLAAFVRDEWGRDKVRSWDHWVHVPAQVADRLGTLVGAAPGQVALGDSTSVQLYKLAVAALDARPEATAVALADDEFPTDRFVVAGVAEARGLELRTVPTDGRDGPITARAVEAACADGRVGLVVASLVRFRTAARADLAAVTAAAQAHGALVLWDLSHAVGAVEVDLDAAGADLAVGCTYKYLNAGPGAPAFAYRATRHGHLHQPIHGWFGQRDQFAMAERYDPHPDVNQLLVGTPPMAGLVAVGEGVALVEEAGPALVAAQGQAMVTAARAHAEAVLAPLGVEVATPAEPARRGSHLALRHPRAAALVAGLLDGGITVDHRAPDIIRLAAAPLHTRHVDLWDAVDALRALLAR